MKPKGLTKEEAAIRLTAEGYNELPSARPKNILTLGLQVIREPMFLLLIACGMLYLVLGDYHEGIVLMSSILIIIFITFYQYQKTERALEALKNLSSPRALVIRDEQLLRIPGREVVRGDLMILQEGDRVAADAVLTESENLLVDESMLTGESVSVTKQVSPGKIKIENPGGENNFNVFAGTMILRGKATALVLATGTSTCLGRIGVSLQFHDNDESRLQKELTVMIRRFGVIGVGISIIVFILYYLTRGDLIYALLSSLSSAMAILPEEFPVVMTVFLALGAWRISRKNVLTRKPSAIEALGSATVLCSDKTGTITLNRMMVAAMKDLSGNLWKGGDRLMKPALQNILRHAAAASPDHPADPMERAVVDLYSKIFIEKLPEINHSYPLSSEMLAITNVRVSAEALMISCKGAVETVSELCRLSEVEKEKIFFEADQLATDGFRVLAVSEGISVTPQLPPTQKELKHHFLGLIAFEDPVHPEVPAAMEECRDAGIKVMMITGDYPATAISIGKQIGLNHDRVMTGQQLALLSDEELKDSIRNINIFARVLPDQKLRIVEALKSNGEVVAMTGDGINDAPALKAANIGVAMGMKGTDVAREASALVLLDDNFASIVSAVRLGRRIYDNLQKAMMYILAIHIPIIGLALLPAMLPEIPFLLFPLHIVFMEMIIDPVCSIAFESEPEEKGLMKRVPRNPNADFFGKKSILKSIMNGSLILISVLVVYFWSIEEGHKEGESRAIAFTTLILCNVGFILSGLSRSRYAFQVIGEKNPAVKIILGFAVLALVIVMTVPFARRLFGFEVPDWHHFIPSIGGSLAVVTILEIQKLYLNRKGESQQNAV
ncbi:MAG: cation-translocating P-type ATPase [Cyclobacteriaceae bacterium]